MADWENGAAWPGAQTQQQKAATPAGQLGPREMRQFQVMRRRTLTPAGNAINLPVTAALTTLAITFAQQESDLTYGVAVTPNWGTTLWVTAKAVTGFTLNFGTAAPANAALDYTTFRMES